ncbi:MAG: serine/threonine-protein phosphatase, partial [Synergistaceae bacterium]|nr:serine/threonine-protein phosphatase [Synergistaceae bacterium]
MSNFCTDIGWRSLNKHGEKLCGDRVEIVGDESPVVVLADGLGSGVKANILSTLTAKIISTMASRDMSVEQCVSAVVATLPVCPVRRIAYSTFTIMKISGKHDAPDDMEAEIIQYDNPRVIMLRSGKNFDYPVRTEIIDGKTILKSRV